MVSLKRMIVELMVLAALVGGVAVLSVRGCRARRSDNAARGQMENANWQAEYLDFLKRDTEKSSQPLDPVRREKIATVVEKVSLAYRQHQGASISQVRVADLVSMAGGCPESSFYHLILPLVELLQRGLCEPQSTRFDSEDELRAALEARWATIELLGGTLLARRDFDGSLMFLETWYLQMLTDSRKYYEARGAVDCLNIVNQMHARCLSHIESENGFTRMWLRREMENELWLVRRGLRSSEDVPTRARTCVRLMIDVGYTPKWLDEEFPLLPEGSAKKETDLPE